MTQSLIRDIKQNWKPSFTGARKHVRLVIKEYSLLDTYKFIKQLDTTLRGLVIAGFTVEDAFTLIRDELLHTEEEEFIDAWINHRTASEIVSNN